MNWSDAKLMTSLQSQPIQGQRASVHAALLALNNKHEADTSFQTEHAWRDLIDKAFCAICFDAPNAFLIAVDDLADYDNANFKWFKERYSRFIYIDRIVVADRVRGQGIARRLYGELFQRALCAGQDRAVCEVNLVPPNSTSDAFHSAMGFSEVGRAVLSGSGKTVRYLSKCLPHKV